LLESALAQISFISNNYKALSEEELKEQLKILERELMASVLVLKKLRLEVIDNIADI
jgi:hypothetical protein